MSDDIKCRKCRKVLFTANILLTNHGLAYDVHEDIGDNDTIDDTEDIADEDDDISAEDIASEDYNEDIVCEDLCTGEDVTHEDVNTVCKDNTGDGMAVVKTSTQDSCTNESKVYYLNEDQMTDWMREQVDVNEWTKGRLVCPTDGCHQRIGSFDFINGHKCRCRSYVLPNIQIIKSRVDKQMVIIHSIQ